jgi:predicted nucleic acid-binding protein
MIYVLDASAMIAYMRAEPGGDVVRAILRNRANLCYAHAVNLVEVFYDYRRASGLELALQVLSDLEVANVARREDLDWGFCDRVASAKVGPPACQESGIDHNY